MSPATKPVDSSVLIASINNLDTPHFLAPALASAATTTRNRLTIILFSPLFDIDRGGLSRTEHWNRVQRLLTFTYVQATAVAQNLDKVLMDIDVLLKSPTDTLPQEWSSGVDMVYRITGDGLSLPQSFSALQQVWLSPGDHANLPKTSNSFPPPNSPLQPTFPVVALGGTFDHLHPGHKILLSMGAWIAQEKLIVGVTEDVLLQNKANKHLLEPLRSRIGSVLAFVKRFRSDLQYDVVPIHDVCGPTGWDSNIQALVVSRETVSGATFIAAHREKEGLPALKNFVIDVISPTSANVNYEDAELMKRTKMSSTFIREWIARRLIENKSV